MAENWPVCNSYTWEKLEPMPTKRVFCTAVDVQGTLHVLGGCDAKGTPIDNLESYVLKKKNKWNRLKNMPTPRAGVTALALGSKLMTFGGVNVKQEPVDTVEIYDTEKKDWQGEGDVDTMREKLLGLSAVLYDGKAVVVGGMGYDTNPKGYLMTYDININKWGVLPEMPTRRYATFSFLIGKRLYVLGGRQGKLPVAALEAYSFDDGKWRTLPDIPSKRVFASYATDNDNKLFSCGGLQAGQKMSDVMEIFDIRNEEWTVGNPMPQARGDFAMAYLGNKVVCAGGLGMTGKPLQDAEAYDPATDSWSILPKMSNCHCSCASTVYQDRLYVIGGLAHGGSSNAVDAVSFND